MTHIEFTRSDKYVSRNKGQETWNTQEHKIPKKCRTTTGKTSLTMVSQLYYRIVSKACLFQKRSSTSCTSVAEKCLVSKYFSFFYQYHHGKQYKQSFFRMNRFHCKVFLASAVFFYSCQLIHFRPILPAFQFCLLMKLIFFLEFKTAS